MFENVLYLLGTGVYGEQLVTLIRIGKLQTIQNRRMRIHDPAMSLLDTYG